MKICNDSNLLNEVRSLGLRSDTPFCLNNSEWFFWSYKSLEVILYGPYYTEEACENDIAL